MSLYFQFSTKETERSKRHSDPLDALWTGGFTPDTKFTINYPKRNGYWGSFVDIKLPNGTTLHVDYMDISIFINGVKVVNHSRGKKIFEYFGSDFEVTMKKTHLQTNKQGFDFSQRVYTFTPTKNWRTADQRYAFMGANADLDRRIESGQPLPDYVPPSPGELDGQMFNKMVPSRDLQRNIAEYLGGGKRKSIRSTKRNRTRRRNRNKNKNGGSRKKITSRKNHK